MRVHLAYGKSGLDLDVPDAWNAQVIAPRFVAGVSEPLTELRTALRHPLGAKPLADCAHPTDRVGIIVNDITRATPSPLILKAIIGELAGIPSQNITIFNALGTHRPNTEAELRQMLGDEVVDLCRIVQNNAFDPGAQMNLGRTRQGHEIRLNRELMECPVKILTGFIEPHFFAGFSGGGKAIMPGMAGLATILGNHCAANISHPQATWGVTHGNPIWEEIGETANKVDGIFLVNVTLNRDKEITRVFAGDLDQAHAAGVAFVRETAMAVVDAPFDIVVTTNAGYPLDLNLYQSVKGMSAAAQIVKPGGAIVLAAECWDGIPDHGLYGQLLQQAGSPQAVLENLPPPGLEKQDQWQAQIQAQIQRKADVFVHSGGLSEAQIRRALLNPAPSLEATLHQLRQKVGPAARLCILPEGPLTIPYIHGMR